jgi:Fur family peroxide stress response transcriptional regulator
MVLDEHLNQRLTRSGLRPTPQRQAVYSVLLQKLDHPSADQVFLRAKQVMADISMATVYNCLETLVRCGLVRQVNANRAATRFCPNMAEHSHFYCSECGSVHDIFVSARNPGEVLQVPEGFQAEHYEISVRGLCPACRAGAKKQPAEAPPGFHEEELKI